MTQTRERCVEFPSKRRFTGFADAQRAAELRRNDTGLDIRPRECAHCDGWHLADFGNGDKPLADLRIATAPVPEGSDSRVQTLAAWIDSGHPYPSTNEIVSEFGWHRKTVSDYMVTLGYVAERGRGARWAKRQQVERVAKLELVPAPEEKHTPTPELEAAMRRHPAALAAGWEVIARDDLVRHISLGDFIDSLAVAGVEVRIQVRRKP